MKTTLGNLTIIATEIFLMPHKVPLPVGALNPVNALFLFDTGRRIEYCLYQVYTGYCSNMECKQVYMGLSCYFYRITVLNDFLGS